MSFFSKLVDGEYFQSHFTKINNMIEILESDKSRLNNTSGTNTGDETSDSIKNKLGVTILSGSNTGDQDLSNYVTKETGKSLYSDTMADARITNVLNQANGIAGLDQNKRIVTSQLPSGYDKGVTGGLAEYDSTSYRGITSESYFDGLLSDSLSIQSLSHKTGTGVRSDGTVYTNPLTFKDVSGIRVKQILGVTLKNEITYTPSTWAEWTGKQQVNADSSGAEFVADGVTPANLQMTNTQFKTNTKYGMILNIVSNTVVGQCLRYDTASVVTQSFYVTNTGDIGNKKFTFVTNASITSNYVRFYMTPTTAGLSIKLKDIRIFELPTGSLIESDFNNLTADQLATKYPFINVTTSVVNPTIRSQNVDGSIYTDLAVTGTLRSVADTALLENKLDYDTTSWPGWGVWGSGASKSCADSTGFEVTVGTGTAYFGKSITVEPSTKYVLIYEILSGDYSAVTPRLDTNYCAFATPANIPKNFGLNKVILTTVSNITYPSFSINIQGAVAGTTYKFKNFALYKITTQQMFDDATNMTAAQFIAKYAFFASTGTYLTGTISQDRLYNNNGKWYIDRWVDPATGLKLSALTTEAATVTGNLVAYKGGTLILSNSTVAPKCDLQYVENWGEWESYTPTLTWSSGTPATNVVSSFKYCKIGKKVRIQGNYKADDGNGATTVTITLPFTAKSYSGAQAMAIASQQKVNTTWSVPIGYIDDSTSLVKFRTFATCTDNVGMELCFSGEYEMA